MTDDILNDYWCSDKTAELALYYNLAFDRLVNYILQEEQLNNTQQVEQIIKAFKNNPDNPGKDFSEAMHVKLKNYLYKGFYDDKNTSGTTVTEWDKNINHQLLSKLEQIRNFQSHYYHANDMLGFRNPLKSFINDLFQEAQNGLERRYPRALSEYQERIQNRLSERPWLEELFTRDKNDHSRFWLNREGKNFLLSLFLTKGEMQKFLKQRKGCKRDDTPDFKIKHEIYTYYCHREGAARFHYNIGQTQIANQSGISEEIHGRQQLYRINTFLNDVSPHIVNPELFPLFFNDEFIEDAGRMIQFCQKHAIFNQLGFHQEESKKHDKVLFFHSKFPEIKFSLKPFEFHKLILDGMKGHNNWVQDKAHLFCLERKQLLRLLNSKDLIYHLWEKRFEGFNNWLSEYDQFRLRTNNEFLRTDFATWWSRLLNNHSEEPKARENTLKNLANHPVELRYYDFYREEDRKPRAGDEFMRFAVHYMIDYQVVPKVCWQWQSFQIQENSEGKQVLKEFTCFAPQKPTTPDNVNWRLKFTQDNQIAYSLEATTPVPKDGTNKDQVQPFLIGHKAMRNLLIAHLIDGHPLQSFFLKVNGEVQKLRTGKTDFELLFDKAIPKAFKDNSDFDVHQATINRIYHLKSLFKDIRNKAGKLSRAEKNRQIMRCHRLFDWQKRQSNQAEQFLRSNEYNQLSKYHYMLEKQSDPHYKRILNKILREIKETNFFPDPVWRLLNKSKDLNELLDRTLEESEERLDNWLELVPDLPFSKIKPIAQKLGVPTYDNEPENSNQHIPFAIHPLLPLKQFYSEELKTDPDFNLAKRVRENPSVKGALNPANYDIKGYFDFFGGASTFKEHHPKIYKKIIGKINESLTCDGLLFKIGQQYDSRYQSVTNMHQEEVCIHNVGDGEINLNNGHLNSKPIRVFAQYNQLQSVMLTINEGQLQSLAQYIFLQGKAYEDIAEEETHWYVPFKAIKEEWERVNQLSLVFIEALLNWEKGLIEANPYEVMEKTQNKEGLPHVNFEEVLTMSDRDKEEKEDLKKIRNTALHGHIPNGWTYDDKKNNPVLGGYIQELLNQKLEQRLRFQDV